MNKMKQNAIYIIWVYLMCLCIGCTDTDIVNSEGTIGTEEVMATLRFSHQTANPVNITTRATLDVVPESRVQNLFVYLCVGEKCIYTHYFDKENLMELEDSVASAKWDCWYVNNLGINEDPAIDQDATHGVIRLRTADVTGATLYLVANIDADMVNISPEKLNTIRTKQEIENLTATLNQEITSRNGYFPMSAVIRDVSISNNTVVKNQAEVIAELVRLDAKVRVNVRTAVGNVNSDTVGGGEDAVTTRQELSGFIPQSWRVINIPKGAYVMPYVAGEGARTNQDYEETEYFNTEEVGFEETVADTFTFVNSETKKEEKVAQKTHSFSFYMLENQESSNRGGNVTNYHSRDQRTKDPITGQYIKGTDGGIWDYAPELATYLEIKGQVEMVVDVSTSAKQQHLAAEVTYYIHLGDFGTLTGNPAAYDFNNYDITRNTNYTYTITIKGVNNIEVEVKTSQSKKVSDVIENESGATGQVYVAEEEIFTFDAHYGQRVYMIDAATIDPENVTWYVSTPFSEGVPEIVGGTEVPAGKDYKWVQFMINKIDGTGEDRAYSKNNQKYPGDGNSELKDVVEFTKFIKTEVTKTRDNNPNTNSEYFIKECDDVWYDWYQQQFPDEELDKEDKTQPWWRDRMYVTIFVDEFYYEVDPITGNERSGLWKEFVNQPNRLMHILCDNQESLDQASSSTGSIVTIRQRSIQTPYNITNPGLMTAWGCETEDEMRGKDWAFYESNYTTVDEGNYPTDNGLYNTACLWKLLNMTGYDENKTATSFNENVRWDNILDYEQTNNDENLFLLDDTKSMKYGALARNRDNNGNGVIDPEEVRWYIASLEQLYGLYLGGLGLSSDAQLYSAEAASQAEWRSHIVCSNQTTITTETQYVNKYWPELLWAEEGVSISGYGKDKAWSMDCPNSIRCIRNLGMANPTKENIIDPEANTPTPIILIDSPAENESVSTNTVYRFNLSNINDKSVRFYTTRELETSNEHNEMSRPYYGFETDTKFISYSNYSTLKALLDAGKSPCPEGYRVPNVREAALLSLYCHSDWWNGKTILSCSYYSHGIYGDKKDDRGKETWQFMSNYVTVNDATGDLRCVRDWNPNYVEDIAE